MKMQSSSNYHPSIHHRRSIRLKGYDYSGSGLYFITICVQDQTCLFGRVVQDEMVWNDAGRMIEKWYAEIENKFPDIQCNEHIVMPNHFHCIVHNVGADLRVRPDNQNTGGEQPENIWGEHVGSPLHRVVQWFKTMTTNEYIRNVKAQDWPRFNGKLWQRNYHEHIIRNEQSLQRIRHYILNNPAQWGQDKLNADHHNPLK